MCWIIPLIVGLLSALLGYFIGKRKGDDNEQFITKLNKENDTLRHQLEHCENEKAQYETTQKSDKDNKEQLAAVISDLRAENLTLKQSLSTCKADLAKKAQPPVAPVTESNSNNVGNVSSGVAAFAAAGALASNFDADAAQAAFGKKIKDNDLTIIEGIGPKIAELFHQADITTWKQLSKASVEQCQEILNKGGERFAIHNPSTWPRQAELATNNEWEKLFEWQEVLDGGKE